MVLDERTLPIAAWALDTRSPAAWRSEVEAVGARVDRVLELGAERMSANGCTISYFVLRRGTLADRVRTEAEPGRSEVTGDRQVRGEHS